MRVRGYEHPTRLIAVVAVASIIVPSAPVTPAQATPTLGPTGAATFGDGGWTLEGNVVPKVAGTKIIIQPSIWPNHSSEHGKGTAVDMLSFPPVYSSTGHYQIHVAPSAAGSRYVNRDGSLSVRLIISDGESAEIQETTVDRESLAARTEIGEVNFKLPQTAA